MQTGSKATWPFDASEMAGRVRDFDWTRTPLGAIPGWSPELKMAVSTILASAFPSALVWGPDLVTIYNDGFRPILGAKPDALGRSFAEIWQEAWAEIGPIARRAMAGESTFIADYPLAIDRSDQREQAYFTFSYSPVRDANGTVLGFIDTVLETTDAVNAREAARQSEARLAAVVDSLPIGVAVTDAGGKIIIMNTAMHHYTPTALMPSNDPERLWRWRAFDVQGQPIAPQDFPSARGLRGESTVPGLEMLYTGDDDQPRWTSVSTVPIQGDHGQIAGQATVMNDIDQLKRSEAELRASEERFRSVVEGVPQLVWRASQGGQWTWTSPQWSHYTGQAEKDGHGSGWLAMVHPDDHDRISFAWTHAGETGQFTSDYRIRHAAEGRYRWFQTRALPVGDKDAIEWLGTSTDIDELRELQERQQLLLAELQHRVRNILTVVRSVFARTMDGGGPIEELCDHFKGRLDSLARTQTVVTRNPGGQIDLENLIRDELLSVASSDGPSLSIEGPEVFLDAKAAESLGLAIHELTTNAIKYGALKVPGAKLDIRWRTDLDHGGERRLDLTWTEHGVPAVPVGAIHYGFGSELIEEALPYRLGAKTELEFRGGGICCTISVPLPEKAVDLVGPGKTGWR
ncbi:PAS domain-containing protein [Sphingomonas sp. DBB INV C78]|uniref:PAS domain-containing sensor histidine kinase n=1 Tax=Sphingomonas sp. DBB INV C78 TaxID=3349434 RepID=UPI0036D26B29